MIINIELTKFYNLKLLSKYFETRKNNFENFPIPKKDNFEIFS